MLVEEFLREDKLEHGAEFVLTTRETVFKKAASKPQGSFFCFLVGFLNSIVNKDCFSQAIKKPLSFHT